MPTTPPNPKGVTGLLLLLLIVMGVGCMISNARKQQAPDWTPGSPTPTATSTIPRR